MPSRRPKRLNEMRKAIESKKRLFEFVENPRERAKILREWIAKEKNERVLAYYKMQLRKQLERATSSGKARPFRKRTDSLMKELKDLMPRWNALKRKAILNPKNFKRFEAVHLRIKRKIFRALEVFERFNRLSNLEGEDFRRLGELIERFARPVMEATKMFPELLNVFIRTAKIFSSNLRIESALFYTLRAKEIAKKLNNQKLLERLEEDERFLKKLLG
jgi:hypothetical protein